MYVAGSKDMTTSRIILTQLTSFPKELQPHTRRLTSSWGSIGRLLPPAASARAEHSHERVAAQFLVRQPALQQPDDLGETGAQVEFLRLAERLRPARQEQLRYRVKS